MVIWTVGSVPFFGKGGSSVLAKCSLYGIETSFCFRQAQYVQVFPLKSVAFCNLSADPASTNKSAISLFFSASQTFALFTTSWFLLIYSLLSLLPQTLWQIWQEFSSLSSCTIRLQWIPGPHFSRGTTQMMSWLNGESYLCPLQPLVVSHLSYPLLPFLGLEAYCLIYFFDKQVSSEELVLPRHACCVLSGLRCNGHSPLSNSYLSRIIRM